jgi:hypothetical protein
MSATGTEAAPTGGSPTRRRLYLHVGLPKSGTSFLQSVLAENRARLKSAGLIYPFVRREGMFHAAVELRGQHQRWGLAPELVDGTWDQLLDRARGFAGNALISHEILAGAAPDVVARAGRDTADFELHVVVTVRDLLRQVPAHWQEEVKNGRAWSFRQFQDALFDEPESVAAEHGFWRSQDLVDVVRRWSAVVPPERLHIVVVPQPGAPPDELWRRFAGAVGVDPGAVDLAVAVAANDSLGVAQVALLRHVVLALRGRLTDRRYADVVKRFFAQGVLSRQVSDRPVVPPELAARLAPMAHGWIGAVEAAGHPVSGELAELVPPLPSGNRHPDAVPDDEVVAELPEVVADVLVEVARLRREREASA